MPEDTSTSGVAKRNLRRVGNIVDRRIESIQGRYLDSSGSSARALLAQLRNAAAKEPGADPAIWEITHDPEAVEVTFEDPTWDEMAIHVAMTTYAIHQQSRTSRMHVPGKGFGRAVRELVGFQDENPSARARFNRLVTADNINYLRHDLRAVASLLRAESIAFDYAMLADELRLFQQPGGKNKVRLRWSRQYYQGAPQKSKEDNNTDKEL